MAEGIGHLHNIEGAKVYSAGLTPSGKVNPKMIEATGEVGYELSKYIEEWIGKLAQEK